jgi:hypothetical protein
MDQLRAYKIEEKIELGVREWKRLNITGLDNRSEGRYVARHQVANPVEQERNTRL